MFFYGVSNIPHAVCAIASKFYGAKVELIVHCFKHWEEHGIKCADTIVNICKKEAVKVAEEVFGRFTFSSLDRASRYAPSLMFVP